MLHLQQKGGIMKKDLFILQKSELFTGMGEQEIDSMLECLTAVRKQYRKGEYIYRAGDVISRMALVLNGTVHIDKEDYWGNNSLLAEVSAGELLGETYTCLDCEPAAINAIAVRDSEVLLMDLKKIFTTCTSVCPHHAHLIQNFVRVLAMKNRELTRKMEHLSQRTIRDKLLSYLSEQSMQAGSAAFEIPFNRQQLADYLSVDRSALSKELGKLKAEGIIDFQKNRFHLLMQEKTRGGVS